MIKFFDTCALLNTDLSKEKYFYISSISLQELENIKTNRNKTEELRYKARKTVHWLDENKDNYKVFIFAYHYCETINNFNLEDTNDTRIISTAYAVSVSEDIIFVSDDLCCKTIARDIYGLNVISSNIDASDEYKGFKEIVLSDSEMAHFYENASDNKFGLLINEYIIIKNSKNEIVDKLRWNGSNFEPVKVGTIKSDFYGNVKPYNGDIYQQCVLDSLNKNQITMIKGAAGTGKSYLALGYLFYLLEKHKIDKIVMFVNPTPTANAAKLGFLPGSQLEKIVDSSVGNMLSGKLGDKYVIDDLVNRRKLDVLPMCDIRGFDTTGLNCGVYITEAQNLDISLMKLALQRIGEDSFCIVEGDYNAQVDLIQYTGHNNGMRRMSEVFRGQDFYGEIELQNIYRSKIADIAELM